MWDLCPFPEWEDALYLQKRFHMVHSLQGSGHAVSQKDDILHIDSIVVHTANPNLYIYI